jgi:hypothetical protein
VSMFLAASESVSKSESVSAPRRRSFAVRPDTTSFVDLVPLDRSTSLVNLVHGDHEA